MSWSRGVETAVVFDINQSRASVSLAALYMGLRKQQVSEFKNVEASIAEAAI